MFRYSVPQTQDLRDAPFYHMQTQGLLPYAMSSFANPTLADWRAVSDPARAWLVCCEDAHTGALSGVGLFTPWRGRVWEFDFTAFRHAFCHAVPMARGGFTWIFEHAPCDTIIGICPAPNRHAWRLAQACGFQILGRIPSACFFARQQRHVDGIAVVITPQALGNSHKY